MMFKPVRPTFAQTIRARFVQEPLEARRLLSGVAPAAAADSYTVREDAVLDVYAGVNRLYLDGRPGSFVWSQNSTFTDATGRFNAAVGLDGNAVSINYTDTDQAPYFTVNMSAPAGTVLSAGTYPDIARDAFNPAGRPGLFVYGNGRAHNTVAGHFAVDSIGRDVDGLLNQFSASFEQYNPNVPSDVLRGSVQYRYADPGSKWGVLLNDTDADGDALTATLAGGPSHGTLTLNANGSFRYTPRADYFGPDSFTYRTSDGTRTTAPVPVDLTVLPVNDKPTFAFFGFPPAVSEDAGPQRLAGYAGRISPGALNESDQKLSFVIQNNNPSLFSVPPSIDAATGDLTYTPAPDANGTARLSIYLLDDGGEDDDGRDDSDFIQIPINVTAVNDAPVAADDTYATPAGIAIDQTAAVPKTAIDFSDPNRAFTGNAGVTTDSGTITSAMPAGIRDRVLIEYHATASPNQSYSVSFRPPQGQVLRPGTYANAVAVSGSAPSSPELYVISNSSIYRRNGGRFTILSVRYDAAGNLINFGATFTFADAGVDFSGSVYYHYTPTAPGVLTNDTDTEGDPLKATLVSGPAHGALVLREDGTFKYTPAAGFQGVDTFTYAADDGRAVSGTKTVRITVGTPPPPPTDPASVVLQAETATLSGGTVKGSSNGGYTGTGYADYAGGGSAVQWTTTRFAAGPATLSFRYANGSTANRPLSISVNGVTVGTLPFAPTGSWTTWKTVSVNATLLAGVNTVRAVAGTATGANVDSLTIGTGPVVPPPPPPPPPTGTASLSGSVFRDNNKNGRYDSGDGVGKAVTVFLDSDNDGVLDGGETRLVTDSAGKFKFAGLAAGTYRVRAVLPVGSVYSTTRVDAVLTSGQAKTGLLVGLKTA